MTDTVVHRVMCAALRGDMAGTRCASELTWLDRDPHSGPDARLLELNGWRLDHGKWICGDHS